MIRLITPSSRLYLIGNNRHADKQGSLYQNCQILCLFVRGRGGGLLLSWGSSSHIVNMHFFLEKFLLLDFKQTNEAFDYKRHRTSTELKFYSLMIWVSDLFLVLRTFKKLSILHCIQLANQILCIVTSKVNKKCVFQVSEIINPRLGVRVLFYLLWRKLYTCCTCSNILWSSYLFKVKQSI